MAKLTLNDVTTGFASNTAQNVNNTLIETALENTLSRDGTSPNQMAANLDLNNFKVINLADGTSAGDAVTVRQYDAASSPSAIAAAASAAAALASETAAAGSASAASTSASNASASEIAAAGSASAASNSAIASAASAVAADTSATTAGTYSSLGLATVPLFDLGLITDLNIVFPTDWGTIV